MACILSRNSIKLFISYAPGTGSSALEQHIRTQQHLLTRAGFVIEHYPVEEFGQGATISRHICYAEYLESTGNICDFIATGIRNPFSYYYAEYNRINSKWHTLLNDKDSWIYGHESKNTLELVNKAKEHGSFDSWFYEILIGSVNRGYLAVNENHLNHATHFIKIENLTSDFDQIGQEIFSTSFSELIGSFPIVNSSDYSGHYANHITDKTTKLALVLFGHYLFSFGYDTNNDINNYTNSRSDHNMFITEIASFGTSQVVTHGQLFSIKVNFRLLNQIEMFRIVVRFFDEFHRLAFSKTVELENLLQNTYRLSFFIMADLPVGDYDTQFEFISISPSVANTIYYQNANSKITVTNLICCFDSGYTDLPISFTITQLD